MAGEPNTKDQASQFQEAGQAGRSGLASEFVSFLMHNKKWWLTPIILVIMLVGVLVFLGGTAAAPFIYTLF